MVEQAMTKQPFALIAQSEKLRNSHVPSLKILTLDASVFFQIRVPSIETVAQYEARLSRAEMAAIGFVVAPDYQSRGFNHIWLIVQEGEQIWRWSLVDAAEYDVACEEMPWLAQLSQIFLEGYKAIDYEANRSSHWLDRRALARRASEEPEDTGE